jgi:hypothetical protein
MESRSRLDMGTAPTKEAASAVHTDMQTTTDQSVQEKGS